MRSSVTHSFGLWAWSMLPGPQMMAGMPVSWNSPASVPKATLMVELPPVSAALSATGTSAFVMRCLSETMTHPAVSAS